MRKGIIALICSIISLIIIITGFIFPWHNVYYHEEPDPYGFGNSDYYNTSMDFMNREKVYDLGFSLNSIRYGQEAYGMKSVVSISYSDYKEMFDNNPSQDETSESKFEDMFFIYDTTVYLLLVVLIFAIISLIITIFSILPTKFFKTFKNLGLIFNLIVFILLIIVALYFFISWNSYIQDGLPDNFIGTTDSFQNSEKMGFWYSESNSNYEINMGPGFYWYLLFISAAISLISSIFVFKNNSPWIPTQQFKPQYSSSYPPSFEYNRQSRY